MGRLKSGSPELAHIQAGAGRYSFSWSMLAFLILE
jgi:hypothetical protein